MSDPAPPDREERCSCQRHAEERVGPSQDDIETLSSDSPEPYLYLHQVRCRRCGQRFTVGERTDYHYPLFGWTPIP